MMQVGIVNVIQRLQHNFNTVTGMTHIVQMIVFIGPMHTSVSAVTKKDFFRPIPVHTGCTLSEDQLRPVCWGMSQNDHRHFSR